MIRPVVPPAVHPVVTGTASIQAVAPIPVVAAVMGSTIQPVGSVTAQASRVTAEQLSTAVEVAA